MGNASANAYRTQNKNENMAVIKGTDANRCPTCGLSKDPDTADFVHTRIGLDEAPEPLLCKCKPANETINAIMKRIQDIDRFSITRASMKMNSIPKPDLNVAFVRSMSRNPSVESEARLNAVMSKSLFGSMSRGMFGQTNAVEVREMGCSWWTGPFSNKISKLRVRSNGESVAKVVLSVCEIMPGIKFAISYEYGFSGTIMRPEYSTKMTQFTTKFLIEGVNVILNSRRYECEDTITYASEVEFENGIMCLDIKRVLNVLIGVIGSEAKLSRHIDAMFMSEVLRADHDVVDVTSLEAHRGTVTHKVNGMKVYVFSYKNGYVITFADRDLTIYSYSIEIDGSMLYGITNRPDVMVAELMTDGLLVYIDTLALNGNVIQKPREHMKRPMTKFAQPAMYVRRSWDSIKDVPKNLMMNVDSDGFVCVTRSRTLRMKEPTIDLLYTNGNLYANEAGKRVLITHGHELMDESRIYELDVIPSTDQGLITLRNPRRRMVKRSPNNTDIIRRAFASATRSELTSTILYDITSMSFKMRERVYEMAQTHASMNRRVIVIFGAGRFQEVNQMRLESFSYIAIDPEIDVTVLTKRSKRIRVVEFDERTSLEKQIITISNKPGSVLYYRGRSEKFMMMTNAISSLSSLMIPVVFPFSISYHITIANLFLSSGVTAYGCGFVHDNMPSKGVGIKPVTMCVERNKSGIPVVRTVFGKSTYVEPILLLNSVKNLHPVKSVMSDVWSDVDASTIEIMNRAVIMC